MAPGLPDTTQAWLRTCAEATSLVKQQGERTMRGRWAMASDWGGEGKHDTTDDGQTDRNMLRVLWLGGCAVAFGDLAQQGWGSINNA